MSNVNTGSLLAQALLLALEIYRNHKDLPPDWVPTTADLDILKLEVEAMSAEKFKEEARANVPKSQPAL